MKHLAWPPVPMPDGGHLSASPFLGQYIEDTLLLGDRVAYCLEDDKLWTAAGIVLFMNTPGAPWERK